MPIAEEGAEAVVVDLVVVGAGIAGLATAWAAVQRGEDVRVLEAADRPGGLVRSVRRDGLLLEHGPQALQATAELATLVDGLGLRSRLRTPSREASVRWIVHGGRRLALPSGPRELLGWPALRPWELLRLAAEPLVPPGSLAPETVSDFARRRFGAGAARLTDPLVAGIFGGDPDELEVQSALPTFAEQERLHGSVVRGALAGRSVVRLPRGPLTFDDGVETLVRALAAALGDRLALRRAVDGLEPESGGWRVRVGGDALRTRRVVIACPLSHAARWLGAPELRVPASPVAAVHLAFRREDVDRAPRGFGWLAPRSERADVLGGLYVSSTFPGHAPGMVLVRVMLGGTRAPEQVGRSDADLVAAAWAAVAELDGLRAPPVTTDVLRVRTGIPQYRLGHADRVASWQARWPGLGFVGWDTTGVGVSHHLKAAGVSA